ncbi:MAG TPA: fibronectin/fibrinogen-binding protein [Peptococcaceae bacterium]|nr:MAG: Fibronectin-binding A domain protein [Clostridia bacterium 41_269]HBT20067.1 fibronectin/fibrinogen-binding protein [Peptococcaceae bacterium]
MSFDGLMLTAVKKKLEELLLGSRVYKVYQPEKKTIVLNFGKEKSKIYSLLISAEADAARIHLIKSKIPNPSQPPPFCMSLRKHLESKQLKEINQPKWERILVFHFRGLSEGGLPEEKLLICEIMGKHSNIILLNSDNTIIDAAVKYSHAVSSHREVLPGKPYITPPDQGKINPESLSEEKFYQLMFEADINDKLPDIILKKIMGLSPQTCREIVIRAGLTAETTLNECGEYELNRIWQQMNKIFHDVKTGNLKPTLVHDFSDSKYTSFAPFDLKQHPESHKSFFKTLNEALEIFYESKKYRQKFKELENRLLKITRREIKRCENKIGELELELKEAEDAEKYKTAGEIITANIFRISKGDKILRAQNFFDPEGKEIEITLDPQLSPSQNAQKYFKKYRKAQVKKQKITEQLDITRQELKYFESVMASIEQAEKLEELEEIMEELSRQKYIPPSPAQQDRKKTTPEFLTFRSSDGFDILVGKNNRQNDYLTFKVAKDDDLWLHTKEIPGAHVIIKRNDNREIPPQTIAEAAILAAFYSRGKNSANVPVDYTYKKYVRKPKGARPGMVIYESHKTISVTPDPEKIKHLQKA